MIGLNGYATRCGVQFDYGLRQGRSLALTRRPESFVSAGGKEMKVDKKVAKINDKTLGRGRVGLSLFIDDLVGCLAHGFPTFSRLSSLFTKNWSAKYSPNRSELTFIWKKSTGRFGAYSHFDRFSTTSCSATISSLVNMLECLRTLVQLGYSVSSHMKGGFRDSPNPRF
jgi:hypothetical protein